MAAKIRKGDKVVVLTGRDKGRTGEVFEVRPDDPVTYLACAGVLLAAVLLAALLPARRAARLPPAVVLGSE